MNQIALLLSLIPLLAQIKAQDPTQGQNWTQGENGGPDLSQYPEWITNDYQCVIGCLSGFNDTITTIPQPDLEGTAYQCAASQCAGDGTGNYYQTLYYIQLFYATGSIYEWSDSAPDGYKHATFNSGQDAQASASAVQATASDPWSADAAEKTGGNNAVDGVSTAPGVTGTGSAASASGSAAAGSATGSVTGTAKTGSAAAAATSSASSANGTKSANGTEEGNSSSGALPAQIAGLAGMGLRPLVGLLVGVASIAIGGVFTGL
ncbi:hypothetical protein I203_103795 [Kwoniella mangroviensis CBS 8507]|uniref:uncharacterized protein n=1 Tax=Kwoniella mangroviensis CBS 8507 TaxID=1296122 RepID=UPI00080D7616|nr:uncharacterized protein I203_04112 [Kwoniella mangroviensis CBS 8507]OCF66536.1 hypothetical protein I203_04112 [Kwoniella mangroviensis CBS 8507]